MNSKLFTFMFFLSLLVLTTLCEAAPIHNAIRKQDINTVKDLIKEDRANIDLIDIDEIPIFIAIRGKSHEIAELLINEGAKINVLNEYNMTPLQVAIEYKRNRLFDLLIKNGFDIKRFINEKTKHRGTSMLESAIASKDNHFIGTILEYNPDLYSKNQDNESALHYVMKYGNVYLVDLLVKNGLDIRRLIEREEQAGYHTTLDTAIRSGKYEFVELAVNHGATFNYLNASGRSPLCKAIFLGYEDIADLLIDRGASITSEISKYPNSSYILLQSAIESGNKKLVELILNSGVDPNTKLPGRPSHLYHALINKSFSISDTLIERGANINERLQEGQTLLHYALQSESSDYSIIDYLIYKGADFRLADSYGLTPLHCALLTRNVRAVDLMIKKGLNLKDEIEQTPEYIESYLGYAVLGGSAKLVDLVLDNGANIDQPTGDNEETALFKAVRTLNPSIMGLLIRRGADVTLTDKYGNTLLHSAHNPYIAQILIQQGLDKSQVNDAGLLPLDMIRHLGSSKLSEVLTPSEIDSEEIQARNKIRSEAAEDIIKIRQDFMERKYQLNRLKEVEKRKQESENESLFWRTPLGSILKALGLTNNECPVCLEQLNTEDIVVKAKCNHGLHLDCMKMLFKSFDSNPKKTICPICREPLSEDELLKNNIKILKHQS